MVPTNEKSLTFRWSNGQNPQIKKSKIAKIDKNLNLDLEVVAHSQMVQNTSKTPKLPILSVRTHPSKNASHNYIIMKI